MRRLRIRLLTSLILAAAPALVMAGDAPPFDITLDLWAASSRFGAQTFKSGSGCSLAYDNACARGMLNGRLFTLGISITGRAGIYEVGALFDSSSEYDTIRTEDSHFGVLGGVALDLVRWIRLEGLAEVGAHEVFDIGKAGVNPVRGDRQVWLPYVGVRPSVTVRIGLVGPLRFVFGFAAFARVDVVSTEAIVSGSNPDVSARYNVGGWNVGMATRAGFEL